MDVNEYIKTNWTMMEEISKLVLHSRWCEGISEYYLYLQKGVDEPKNPERHFYYFMTNLNKPNSAINYIPTTFRGSDLEWEISVNEETKLDMMMDLGDEVAVDFLINNNNNERWLKIYNIVYRGGLQLDLFEKIIFEYVFLRGMSIREIVSITGNSQDYIYKTRRALISKIKEKIN